MHCQPSILLQYYNFKSMQRKHSEPVLQEYGVDERLRADFFLKHTGEFRDRIILETKKSSERYQPVDMIGRNRQLNYLPKSLQKCLIEGTYLIVICSVALNRMPTINYVVQKKASSQTNTEPIELYLQYSLYKRKPQDPIIVLKQFLKKISDLHSKNKPQFQSKLLLDFTKQSSQKSESIVEMVNDFERSDLFISGSILCQIVTFSPMMRFIIRGREEYPKQLCLYMFLVRKQIEEIFRQESQKNPFMSSQINHLAFQKVKQKVSNLLKKNPKPNRTDLRSIAKEVLDNAMYSLKKSPLNIFLANLLSFLDDLGIGYTDQSTVKPKPGEPVFWTFRYKIKLDMPTSSSSQRNGLRQEWIKLELRYSQNNMIEVVVTTDTMIHLENKDFIDIKSMLAPEFDGEIDISVTMQNMKFTNQDKVNGPNTQTPTKYVILRKYDRDFGTESIFYRLFKTMNVAATLACLIKQELCKSALYDEVLEFQSLFASKLRHYLNWSNETVDLIVNSILRGDNSNYQSKPS